MREIKFRAWDTKEEVMINPVEPQIGDPLTSKDFFIHGCGTVVQFNPNSVIGPVYNLKIMRFTGLLDSKGKEIYEGDLVQWFIKSDPGQYDLKVTVEVTIDPLEGTRPFSDPCYNIKPEECEVIGNIYEHCELLNELR